MKNNILESFPECLGGITLASKPDRQVMLCYDASKTAYVIKIGKNFQREVETLKILSHPLICKLIRQGDNYLVLEAVLGGPLQRHLRAKGQFRPDIARFYASQLATAIKYMHSKCIIHRDIKLSNCVLDSKGRIKLIDFGAAAINKTSSTLRFTLCGTTHCMAPEMLTRSGHSYGVDWWALGIFFVELLTSKPPFWHENYTQLCRLILQGKAKLPQQSLCGNDTLLAIHTLLDRDPTIRAQAYEANFAGFGLDSILIWSTLSERSPPPSYFDNHLGYIDWLDDIISDAAVDTEEDDDCVDRDLFLGF